MHSHIPTGAGSSRLVRENINVRGRKVRVARIVFTTHDGFMGEAILRGSAGPAIREAYEAAVAARAAALFKAQQATVSRTVTEPVSRSITEKPAPEAKLLTAIKDTLLFSECERRGYLVSFA
jgi:hypothetical protein